MPDPEMAILIQPGCSVDYDIIIPHAPVRRSALPACWRLIQFFFERQREDGMIQNFAGYESETGPLLWTAGEHFRYTHDAAWVRRSAKNIRSAADFLLKWRNRNQSEKARKQDGYGLIDGKTADPDEFFHSFFLNAGAYLGLKRTAEMFKDVDPFYAAKLNRELPMYSDDIRFALSQALAKAPLVPAGDGSWAPFAPPFTEARGATTLYANGGRWYTHGAFASRGSLLGPLWLVIGEILDPYETATDLLVKANAYPVTLENAALSQPYYSRHDYAHLRRGEIKAFLKTYYNQLTALHDRETGSFWEHYYHCSQHKTHEEAWFLMQTRWMLWLESGDELRLLEAIPRQWLAPGKEIVLRNTVSYFGRFSLSVKSSLRGAGQIEAKILLEPRGAAPKSLRLRLPHPERRIARKCEGGVYQPEQEAVTIAPARREHSVLLEF